jgi:hypothetical protein
VAFGTKSISWLKLLWKVIRGNFKFEEIFFGSVFISRKYVILMTQVVRVEKDISGQFKSEKNGRALPTSD